VQFNPTTQCSAVGFRPQLNSLGLSRHVKMTLGILTMPCCIIKHMALANST